MVGGGNTSPVLHKTADEIFFDLIDCLCNRFIGLSPFEVLNRPTREVFDLYVDVINHDIKSKQSNFKKNQDEWVTSQTADWH